MDLDHACSFVVRTRGEQRKGFIIATPKSPDRRCVSSHERKENNSYSTKVVELGRLGKVQAREGGRRGGVGWGVSEGIKEDIGGKNKIRVSNSSPVRREFQKGEMSTQRYPPR